MVDFLEGDPDQPIITGRHYNATHRPPYKLAEHKTRMVIKSKTHQGSGYNELRFEDANNREQVFMHGEKDQDIIIKNDRREHIRHDCHLKVDNDRVEEVGQDSSSKVDRDRNEATGRKHSITVGEEQTVQVGDHYHLESGKTQYFHAGKHIVLESDEELTIQSSGGFIKIDSGGITIQGKVVNINSGGSPSIGHPVQANIARAATLATGGSTREAKASEAPQPEPMAMPEPKAPAIASLPGSSQAEALRQAAKAGESRCPVCDKK
jgi:type VI secretion system secreted protein VgrG